MENNNSRRQFFKGIAAFISGIAVSKAAQYIPEEEKQKEELMVSNSITINHNGEEYHPLVVKKTKKDAVEVKQVDAGSSLTIQYNPKIRKADV